MKLTTLMIMLLSLTFCVFSQKLKVKDGIILNDKTPVGKIEGEIGVIKDANLLISTTSGIPVLKIKESRYMYNNPLFKDLYFYIINFEDTGKEFMFEMQGGKCSGEKCLVNMLTEKCGISLEDKIITNQDEIITKVDFTEKFKADTTKNRENERYMFELLKTPGISRDKTKEIGFSLTSASNAPGFDFTTKNIYSIMQDGKIIGTLVKKVNKTSFEYTTEYWISKTFASPQGETGKIAEWFVAYTKVDIVSMKLFTFQDKIKHSLTPANLHEAEKDIVNFLIKNNYM